MIVESWALKVQPPAVPLLDVRNLTTRFHTRAGIVHAVESVSFSVEPGQTIGIVGESGSGKSVSCYSLLGLVPQPPGKIHSGQALFDGIDLLQASEKTLRTIRGKRISMIFQDPMTSLNPYLKISKQLTEPLEVHEGMKGPEALQRAIESLEEVGIPDAAQRIHSYPHEFSGGMRQRVMIAMALITRPELLIADEPTTALDVTIQAQILDLLDQLRKETSMAILLITHNLGIVAQYADRVAVMYSGKVVESAPVEELFFSPAHPYTCGLLNSVPKDSPSTKLETIPGSVPHPAYLPEGCAFHPRCAEKLDKCLKMIPPLESLDSGNPHQTACWLHERLPTE